MWVGTLHLEIDGYSVGLRTDDHALLEDLRQAYQEHTRDGPPARADFTISLRQERHVGRPIPSLQHGRCTMLHSRSVPRVVRRFEESVRAMTDILEYPRISGTGAVVRDGRAVLLPAAFIDNPVIERAVHRADCTIVEPPAIRIDLDELAVIVTEQIRTHDTPSTDDAHRTAPGRYHIESVYWLSSRLSDAESPAVAAARLMEAVRRPAHISVAEVLPRIAALSSRCRPFGVDMDTGIKPVLADLEGRGVGGPPTR